MQNYHNLIYREEEREMLPLCRDRGIGTLPWSPLARGKLARDWTASTPRTADDAFGHSLYARTEKSDRAVAAQLAEVAERRGAPRAQVALAWLLRQPVVSAPILGVTNVGQLDEALGALDVVLSSDEVAQLERCYEPHAVVALD